MVLKAGWAVDTIIWNITISAARQGRQLGVCMCGLMDGWGGSGVLGVGGQWRQSSEHHHHCTASGGSMSSRIVGTGAG